MKDTGWILETIEREAMDRCRSQLAMEMLEGGDTVVLFGLTTRQILWLRHEHMRRTGQQASEIPGATS